MIPGASDSDIDHDSASSNDRLSKILNEQKWKQTLI